jgi:alpha/beta superfamily hydrolase
LWAALARAGRRSQSGAKEGQTTKIERLLIPGAVGPLEALLEWDPEVSASITALVCHPHPLFGGTMHNKVIFRAAKGALQAGLPTLRFNFRGVGKSRGTFEQGVGEREDVRAALDYLRARLSDLPICLLGFSFGAWVGLAVGAVDARVTALVGLGVPVADSDMDYLREVAKPKLIVQGTLDQFGPADQMQSFFDSLREPKQLHWVQGADHFFLGKLGEVQAAVREYLRGLTAGA